MGFLQREGILFSLLFVFLILNTSLTLDTVYSRASEADRDTSIVILQTYSEISQYSLGSGSPEDPFRIRDKNLTLLWIQNISDSFIVIQNSNIGFIYISNSENVAVESSSLGSKNLSSFTSVGELSEEMIQSPLTISNSSNILAESNLFFPLPDFKFGSAISSAYSTTVEIVSNTISDFSIGISGFYDTNITINNNSIVNVDISGIGVSQPIEHYSSLNISSNTISSDNQAFFGISITNARFASILENSISSFRTGIYMELYNFYTTDVELLSLSYNLSLEKNVYQSVETHLSFGQIPTCHVPNGTCNISIALRGENTSTPENAEMNINHVSILSPYMIAALLISSSTLLIVAYKYNRKT